MEESLEVTGMQPIKEYIQWRKATIAAHIAKYSIYELCKGAERMPVPNRLMR